MPLSCEQEKRCSTCRQIKPLSAFYPRRDAPNATHAARCKECTAASLKALDQAKMRLRREDWRRRHRPRVNKRQNERRAANPLPARAACLAWAKKYAAKNAARSRARYARQLKATPAWSDQAAIDDIYQIAWLLTQMTGVPHEVDHILPLKSSWVCGLHVPENLQVLTKSENSRKKNRAA